MKGLMVFLVVALVAANAAVVPKWEPKDSKSVIGDALALVRCVEDVLQSTKDNIDNIKGIVTGIDAMIAANVDKLNACNAIGGENPSIIDQIQTAQCTIELANAFRDEILASIDSLNNSVHELLATGNKLGACF